MKLKTVDSAKPIAVPFGRLYNLEVKAAPLLTVPQIFLSAPHKVQTASFIGSSQLVQYISTEGRRLHSRSKGFCMLRLSLTVRRHPTLDTSSAFDCPLWLMQSYSNGLDRELEGTSE